MNKFGGKTKMLENIFPELTWQEDEVVVHKTEKFLYSLTKVIFPGEDVLLEHKHSKLKFSSGSPMKVIHFL